jgi:hypothetical protein
MVRPGAPKKFPDPNDGPHSGTTRAADAFGYLGITGPEYDYLRHFRKEEFLEEGHNTSDGAVSKKIGKLMHEGKPQKQAVAMALSMKRAHRLTKSGGYRRVGK